MKNFERGRALLDLLGTPVKRPKAAAAPASNGVCKVCSAVVTWSSSPAGNRTPLDVHPEGDWVIRDGVMQLFFEPTCGDARRYVAHFKSCKNSSNKETPQ
jgi:hypothetical protein